MEKPINFEIVKDWLLNVHNLQLVTRSLVDINGNVCYIVELISNEPYCLRWDGKFKPYGLPSPAAIFDNDIIALEKGLQAALKIVISKNSQDGN